MVSPLFISIFTPLLLWFSFTPCCETSLIQLCRREIVCLFGNRPGFLCPLYPLCVCVYNEVAGSGRQVKRCTRVRNEVFSLYGNGVRGFICTALVVCVLENIREDGVGWFTRSFEVGCGEYTSDWEYRSEMISASAGFRSYLLFTLNTAHHIVDCHRLDG